METKTNLKRTIEIDNIDNGKIDLKRIKSMIDNDEDAKINIKHKDTFPESRNKDKKQKYAEDVAYIGQQALHP